MRQVQTVVDTLLRNKARRATKFMAPDLVVRATRVREGNGFGKKTVTVVLTIGRPNHAERKFIKIIKRAKEPFPVRKIRLTHLRMKAKAKAKRKSRSA